MPTLRELKERLLADGRIDGRELIVLTDLLYADGRIDRAEADFLVELHSRVERVTPGFEKFFHKAIKAHVLAGGAITPEATDWLKHAVLARGVGTAETKLLRELRGEAASTCPEFEALFEVCVRRAEGRTG